MNSRKALPLGSAFFFDIHINESIVYGCPVKSTPKRAFQTVDKAIGSE